MSLIDAVKVNDLQLVQFLCSTGTNVNERDDEGYTALRWAAKLRRFEIVQELCTRGALVDLVDRYGRTPLMLSSDVRIIKLLCEQGHANINHQSHDLRTPLLEACCEGDLEIVKYLCDHA